jgi:hypothetical protein
MTVEDVLRIISERIHPTVCPIYEDDEKKPLVGSSILFKVRATHFLVTAKHVFDGRKSLYIWAQRELIGLEGDLHFSETFDFAFMRLAPELANKLQEYSAIEPKSIEEEDGLGSGRLHAFVGLPETQNRVYKRTLRRALTAFFVTPAEQHAYESLGLSPITHFAAVFDRRRLKMAGVNGTVTGPLPQGMSGGPVWRFTSGAGEQPAKLRVVGLGVKYHKAQRVLVAVRMPFVVASIRHLYPELSSALPLPSRVRIRISTVAPGI